MEKINYIVEQLNNGSTVCLTINKYDSASLYHKLVIIKYNKHIYYSDDIHVNFEVLKTDKTDFKSYVKGLVKDLDLVKYNSQGESVSYSYKVQNIDKFKSWLKSLNLDEFEVKV